MSYKATIQRVRSRIFERQTKKLFSPSELRGPAFLYVYAKNEKTDLTADDKAALRRLVAEIEEAAP